MVEFVAPQSGAGLIHTPEVLVSSAWMVMGSTDGSDSVLFTSYHIVLNHSMNFLDILTLLFSVIRVFFGALKSLKMK